MRTETANDSELGERSFEESALGKSDPSLGLRNETGMSPVARRFSNFCAFFLIYNLVTVAWGVYVRASKSGDGGGTSWPFLDPNSQPLNGPMARIVEGTHRGMTALVGLLAITLVVWAFKAFPKGHLARKASAAALALTLLEGGIGWALVRFKLVTDNDSVTRAGVMMFHVVSTFMLVGSISLAYLAARHPSRSKLGGQGAVGWLLAGGVFGIFALGAGGAISALGHTLRPVDDVLIAAMSPATHWMVRLQPLHPLVACTVGLYLVLAGSLIAHLRPDPKVASAVRWMIGLYAAQMALGALNIWLDAPIWMQMAHLALADLNLITLVAVAYFAFADRVEQVEYRISSAFSSAEPTLRGRALLKAYVSLTKPRVVSLLLFTTLLAMPIAAGGWPGGWLLLAVGVGGYMSAGAANAINMVIDRDIDVLMERTAKRPTVTQTISSRSAMAFAMTLAVGSFLLLWLSANLLTAVLALSGLVFYVVVYTMLLKRRTWHNIVIGGAAGAFPPLVGYAAVTGYLNPLAWTLFGIVFLWTPVHFWALALMIKDEYAKVGVPMLPCVKGDRATVVQIVAYAFLTVAITLLPFVSGSLGGVYLVGALLLDALLLTRSFQLYRLPERPQARRLFKFSMTYLALLFTAMAIDRAYLRSPDLRSTGEVGQNVTSTATRINAVERF